MSDRDIIADQLEAVNREIAEVEADEDYKAHFQAD